MALTVPAGCGLTGTDVGLVRQAESGVGRVQGGTAGPSGYLGLWVLGERMWDRWVSGGAASAGAVRLPEVSR